MSYPSDPNQPPYYGEQPSYTPPSQPYAPPSQPAYGQAPYSQPAYGQPMSQPAYGQPSTYNQPQYAQPVYGQPPVLVAVATLPNNGMAVASMVLGIIAFLADFAFGIGIIAGIVAVILGHVSLNQIKKSAGTQGGNGFAITGLILGYLTSVPVAICGLCILMGIGGSFLSFIPFLSATPTP